jgi:hypothetical protein
MAGEHVNRKEGQTEIQSNLGFSRGTAGKAYSGGKHFAMCQPDPALLHTIPTLDRRPELFEWRERYQRTG